MATLKWVITVILHFSFLSVLASGQALPLCSDHCGGVKIPYPFGTKEGCYLEKQFFITCDDHDTPKAYLTKSKIEVTDIWLSGQLRVNGHVSLDCYHLNGTPADNFQFWITLAKFPISNTRNKFTAVGCDTFATVTGSLGRPYTTGCLSLCDKMESTIEGSCSGIGCCQTTLPKDIRDFAINVTSYRNHSGVSQFNPCSYAFVVEEGNYTFSSADLFDLQKRQEFPVVLDWAIGNQTCDEAKKNSSSYACQDNSYCEDSTNGPGYRCFCFDGYEGNPYLPGGCQDIDECKRLRPCNMTCFNFPGGFNCSCPRGFEGDGFRNGTGCATKTRKHGRFPIANIALGISVSFLAVFLGVSWSYWCLRKRKLIKLREKFFQQNGGIMLQQQLSKRQGSTEKVKIFTMEELKKATNNYHESTILGQGGQGTVYKGILSDNRIVAIKKSIRIDRSQVEQFINEVIVLSQINHRNVVKLLGSCLETEVPLLVYEFISKGTLYDHLHKAGVASIPWTTRLRIAAETAGALSYLHSAASTPIIHRDIKSTNILLDDDYTAKVSDFGASRLIPLDKTQLTTLVQGTLGYLDPEYFFSSQLTEKSDVYSFGVVLVELMTGRKALSFEKPEEEKNLAMCFTTALKEDQLFQIIDHHVLNEVNSEQLMLVAMLAKRCLSVKGDERPTMKEVVMELEGIRGMVKHPWIRDNDSSPEENEKLLRKQSNADLRNVTRNRYENSIRNHAMGMVFDGR